MPDPVNPPPVPQTPVGPPRPQNPPISAGPDTSAPTTAPTQAPPAGQDIPMPPPPPAGDNTSPVQAPDPQAYLTDKSQPEDLSETWRHTKCLNCGYVYEGTQTLTKCPKCGNTDPDKFREAD